MAIECVETQEWIEEEISKRVEEWVERTEEKCKKRSKWNPLRWVCWLVTTLVKVTRWVTVKVGKWVVRTVCKFVGALINFFVDSLTGLWDLIAGIYNWDWRQFLDGLIMIGVASIDFSATHFRIILLGDTLDYIIEEYNRGQLRDYVRKLLEAEYSGEELDNIKDTLRVDHGAFGYRIPMDSIRTFLDSETPSPLSPGNRGVPNLVVLHRQGDIDLHELCGFKFTEGFWNRKRYKTLKKNTVAGGVGEIDNPISEDELNTYLSSRGVEGPKFIMLSMRDEVLKTKLRAAELSARELGLMQQWTERLLEVKRKEEIIHEDDEAMGKAALALVSFLTTAVGREPKTKLVNNVAVDNTALALQDLCTPVSIGVFRYKKKTRGYSTCLMMSASGQGPDDASGVTFIDNKPDMVWKYIPIHELGHYFGLSHVSGLDRIMYSSKEGSRLNKWTLPKLLLTKGEPSFTLAEGKLVWDYIIANFPAGCLGGNP